MNELEAHLQQISYTEDGDIAINAAIWEQQLKKNSIWGLVVVALYTPVVYQMAHQVFWLFLLFEPLSIIGILCLDYFTALSKAKMMNITVTELLISDNEVTLSTMPFKVSAYKTLPSTHIKLHKGDIQIKKVVNPYPYFFNLSKFVIQLRHRNDTYYIIPEYFPNGMENDLRKNLNQQ